jgi:hypothetical protein
MVTIAQVEAIFRRQGWRYQVQGGRILTAFGKVIMVLEIAPNGQAVMIGAPVYIAQGAGLHSFRAHLGEIDAFLDYVRSNVRIGTSTGYGGAYGLDRFADGVMFTDVVPLAGGPRDDAVLVTNIAITGAMVLVLRPIVEALAQGRMVAQQAIEALVRALEQLAREQGRQSA